MSQAAVARQASANVNDVAALVRVSIKTVSRAINQQPTVSPEIVGCLHDAIRLLDYHSNVAAVNFRKWDHKTSTIGLLLKELANPFPSTVHRGVEETAKRRGMLVFAGSSAEDPDREQEVLGAFVRHPVVPTRLVARWSGEIPAP